jgi:hypothetical protein
MSSEKIFNFNARIISPFKRESNIYAFILDITLARKPVNTVMYSKEDKIINYLSII